MRNPLRIDVSATGDPVSRIRRPPFGGGAQPDRPDPAPATVGEAADEDAGPFSSAAGT